MTLHVGRFNSGFERDDFRATLPVSVPAFLYYFQLTLCKTDTFPKRTPKVGPFQSLSHFFTVYIKVMPTSPSLDCKAVRIFAYSSTREQSNKRSGARLKTESETGFLWPCEARALRVRETLTLLSRYTKPTLRKNRINLVFWETPHLPLP